MSPPMTTITPTWTTDLHLLGETALEEVNRLWTVAQVLSNTAHAVKNSLQVTAGNAELMELRAGLDPALLRRVQTIRAQSLRASAAIDLLVEYARPSTSSAAEPLELGELAEQALALRAHSHGRARIQARVDAADAGPYQVRVHRRGLLQLLLNLLLSAEAAIAGWSEATIVIRLGRSGPACSIDVEGSGTAAEPLDRVPVPFGADQDRVMRTLAASLGATLHRSVAACGAPAFALELPADEER